MIEKIIKYQNEAERNFESTKNISTILNYIIAFVLFIFSTFIAAMTFPFRYYYKIFFKNNNDSKIIQFKEKNFDNILNKEELLLIDFWAEWCGPCVMMNSIIEKFASESKNVKVVKVNADLNRKMVELYQVRGLPQFILIENGKEINRFAGAMTLSDLNIFCNKKNN